MTRVSEDLSTKEAVSTARRRHVIETALEQRPTIDLDALHHSLGAIGIDIDVDTLIDDLDALGYDVDDPPGTLPAPPPPVAASHPSTRVTAFPPPATPRPTPGATGPPFSVPTVTAGSTTPTRAPEAARMPASAAPSRAPSSSDAVPRSTARTTAKATHAVPSPKTRSGAAVLGRMLVIGGAVILLAVLVVAIATTVREGDDESAPSSPGRTSSSSRGTPAQSSAPPKVAPVGPGTDPALAQGADGGSDFEVAVLGGLGDAPDPSGATWQTVSGAWEASAGQARLLSVDTPDVAGLALFDPGLDAFRAQMRMQYVQGQGLAFWVTDARNYWMVTASPRFTTFVISEVRDGRAEVVADSGLTEVDDGAATVGVHVTGRSVEALVNGAVVMTYELDTDPPGRAIGMGGVPGAAGGSFDDFVYKGD
jgi:hypothetical protein